MSKLLLLPHAIENFDKAAALLRDEIPQDALDQMRRPKEQVELMLSPQLDDGHTHVVQAFVVRHNDALGPCKGGIRMTPTVTLDNITALAMEMTWKCSLIGVPFGGGKSGIVADTTAMSNFNKETLVRSFARNAARLIGPQVYVPAPDMGTCEADMGHIKGAISWSHGWATTPGCYVTGKPVVLGGIPGRREATGNGVVICIVEAMRTIGMDPQNATAVIQGFGNVGSVAAVALHRLGVRIVAAGDLTGAIACERGLDVGALAEHVSRSGGVKGFVGGEPTDAARLLELPCDVLVPAAAGNQITADNAPSIRARVIAEAANSPTTPQADEILSQSDTFIIPDILCNAGGVFVSYLEYTQETQQEQMDKAEVNSRLERRMADKFSNVHGLAKDRGLSMRDAAMYLALKTVASGLLAKGLLA